MSLTRFPSEQGRGNASARSKFSRSSLSPSPLCVRACVSTCVDKIRARTLLCRRKQTQGRRCSDTIENGSFPETIGNTLFCSASRIFSLFLFLFLSLSTLYSPLFLLTTTRVDIFFKVVHGIETNRRVATWRSDVSMPAYAFRSKRQRNEG